MKNVRSRGHGGLNIVVAYMKYGDFALASSQTLGAGRQEILETRGDVNGEKRASRGEERSGGK